MTARGTGVQACLNGPRLPGSHPALPVTPEAIAADVAAVRQAGAASVHLHPKDEAGRDTLDPLVVDAVLEAVRARNPGVPVGLTTAEWALPDLDGRLAAIAAWRARPDFASVNWHEPGATRVADLLLESGVGIEAGLWTLEAVRQWRDWPSRQRCTRVLLELPDEPDAARVLATADAMLALVGDAAGQGVPVQLHGEDASAWPVLRHARRRGLETRIGLEDTLVRPDGSPCRDNAELVALALATGP